MEQLVRESSLTGQDFRSFKRQEITFIVLNVCLLTALLLTHSLFFNYFGNPPAALIALLTAGVALNCVEFIWLSRKNSLSAEQIVRLTWATIAWNMAVAFGLASLSFRQDIQYFALMIAPIFQAAFRLSLASTLLTTGACTSLIFFWVWNYFRLHPPSDPNEYLEGGTISLIYIVAGLLAWTLVNHLRAVQSALAASLAELEQAKARLLAEEKLYAVGRFSSAIAHEIRNPVAMISSALTTAFNRAPDSVERQEMFDIAAREASRLERLTTDFLAYARPRSPSRERADVFDSIAYIADICRPRATAKGLTICTQGPDGLWADVDGGQLQQALLNLVMNAVEASSAGAVVVLRAQLQGDWIRIDVENPAGPIPDDSVACIFEPSFTTKETGTGLGLAIARSIVLGHGGDIVLSRNRPGMVQFSILLSVHVGHTEIR